KRSRGQLVASTEEDGLPNAPRLQPKLTSEMAKALARLDFDRSESGRPSKRRRCRPPLPSLPGWHAISL
ncbi:unnamed protein product, partial [Polarella glacialis]